MLRRLNTFISHPNGILEFYDYYFSFFRVFLLLRSTLQASGQGKDVELNYLLKGITTLDSDSHRRPNRRPRILRFVSFHVRMDDLELIALYAIAIINFKYKGILSAHSI